ncbi:hypothetical protein KFE25_005520 [Diacronema lutheri]|uniref:Uncharacterized protein n=1 Tax=Diacronema lutheri TaxID=2081491 RepID=A0A8J6CDJ7_DIALT|nr:hypothetical protein KFE25_005520 [Diacronema lutheri]
MDVPKIMRRNRLVGMAASFSGALSRSVWSGDVFSAFLYLVSGSSTHVGVVMGLRGMSQLLLAPCFGYVADTRSREAALRAGALLGVIGAILTSLAAHMRSAVGMCLSQLVWGAHWAAANPSADAVFADSIFAGSRSSWFTAKYQLIQLAGVCGPAISIVVFSVHANDMWRLRTCVLVLDIGCALALIPNALILALVDVRGGCDARETRGPLTAALLDESNRAAPAAAAIAPPPAPGGARAPATRCCGGRLVAAPALVLLYDVISALAAGLVIRFFPIFFMRDLALSPVAVSTISIGALATTAAFGSAAHALAAVAGRVPVAFSFRLAGVCSFVAMAALAGASAPRAPVIAAYLVRMGLINSTFGITKSIIHDLVPPSHRARYASIDSINQAAWAGSAALGGLVIDRYGMVANFYVTASAQLVALVPIALARALVPDERAPGPVGLTGRVPAAPAAPR